MSPKEVYEILLDVFKHGATINGVKIKSENPVSINIEQVDSGRIKITFPDNQPVASFKRFITFSATIKSIVLKEESGFVEVKNFPSIPFGYESFFFDHKPTPVDVTDIESEIETKYCGDKKEIASLCLQYAREWATISSQAVCFKSSSNSDKKKLKKQCLNFVVDNVKNDVKKRHGSVILTYILLVLILPAVAKFIINKLLEKYF